jgi:hypothetical protein
MLSSLYSFGFGTLDPVALACYAATSTITYVNAGLEKMHAKTEAVPRDANVVFPGE